MTLWLYANHAASRSNSASDWYGECADVCSHIDDDIALLDELKASVNLILSGLTVDRHCRRDVLV